MILQAVFGCPLLRCQSRKCINTSLSDAFYKSVCIDGMKECETVGAPLPVPLLSFQSQQQGFLSLYLFLHIHTHPKYTTNLYIFKISIMDSFWQFLSDIAFANTFTRNLDCYSLGITIIAQCYHNSTMF